MKQFFIKRNNQNSFELISILKAQASEAAPPPDLLSLIPIRKTRAGLQFTCAAPTIGLNSKGLKDVWVCNSDGYVGQVGKTQKTKQKNTKIAVTATSARFACSASVQSRLSYVATEFATRGSSRLSPFQVCHCRVRLEVRRERKVVWVGEHHQGVGSLLTHPATGEEAL